jgi:hypothetical protein
MGTREGGGELCEYDSASSYTAQEGAPRAQHSLAWACQAAPRQQACMCSSMHWNRSPSRTKEADTFKMKQSLSSLTELSGSGSQSGGHAR